MLWYIGKDFSPLCDDKNGGMFVYDTYRECKFVIEQFNLDKKGYVPTKIIDYPNWNFKK